MDRLMVSATSILRLAPHIVFRFDDTRQRWIMMAPERLMLPDEQAVEILKLVDGQASVGAITDALAGRYTQGPRASAASTASSSPRARWAASAKSRPSPAPG